MWNLSKAFGGLLLLSSFLVLPMTLQANLLINEIMYDLPGYDSGREWLELYNSGTDNVKVLTGDTNNSWRILDKTQRTLHLIRGDVTIPPGGYVIVANNTQRFLDDWRAFSGTLFNSNFSLNNLQSTISILNSKDGAILNEVSYSSKQGAKGDGTSLQLQSDGSWIAAQATPGGPNFSDQIQISSTAGGYSNNLKSSAHSGAIPLSSMRIPQPINLGAGRDRIIAVGSPAEFRVGTNIKRDPSRAFHWNFGDGSEAYGEVVDHVYKYPGEYTVLLSTVFDDGPAITRTSVKVVDPQFVVTLADFKRIEIKNNSQYEINLLGRALIAGDRHFVFPRDTIIGPNQSLSFSSNVTGLSPRNQYDANIVTIGDANTLNVKTRIDEQKSEKIQSLQAQISDLVDKLNKTINIPGNR